MQEMGIQAERSQGAGAVRTNPVGWRNLREWIELVERAGMLHRVKVEVDPKEELAAITLLSSQRQPSPALLFERLKGDRVGTRVLSNMLGSSVERFALTLGLDPSVHVLKLVQETRALMQGRVAPTMVPNEEAPVTEMTLRGEEIDLTAFPVPTFWPGGRGAVYRDRGHHAHARPGERAAERGGVPADVAREGPRRDVLLARQARPAGSRGLVGSGEALPRGRGLEGVVPRQTALHPEK